MKKARAIFTVGHSTRALDEFIRLLEAFSIEEVVDIRTIPRSRHNPQFDQEIFQENLERAGFGYLYMKGLGGLRHALRDSPNRGWRNLSFRGFADYMQTQEFEESLALLTKEARGKKVALMCAEAVPWRCHRSLVADALTVRGIEVLHIMTTASHYAHVLTLFAEVQGTHITYPPAN